MIRRGDDAELFLAIFFTRAFVGEFAGVEGFFCTFVGEAPLGAALLPKF